MNWCLIRVEFSLHLPSNQNRWLVCSAFQVALWFLASLWSFVSTVESSLSSCLRLQDWPSWQSVDEYPSVWLSLRQHVFSELQFSSKGLASTRFVEDGLASELYLIHFDPLRMPTPITLLALEPAYLRTLRYSESCSGTALGVSCLDLELIDANLW